MDLELVGSRVESVVLCVANKVKAGSVASSGSNSQSLVVGPCGVGCVSSSCSQVRGADFKEIGLQLLLGVLLPIDAAVFADNSSVIVRSVTSRVTKITPVGSSVRHVQVEDSDTKAVQVLVEDTLEGGVDQDTALIESWPTPWVEATGLKFEDTVWCVWALLHVQLVPVRGKCIVGPNVGVSAVEA